eukprot:7669050-Prorocentrum_lima.AAC.1
MTSSLVGSEMCIRDSHNLPLRLPPARAVSRRHDGWAGGRAGVDRTSILPTSGGGWWVAGQAAGG